MFSLIVCCDSGGGIANDDGSLPMKSKQDMEYFKNKTTGQVVIMGRGTWESLPSAYKPLPNRTNVIVSSVLSAEKALSGLTINSDDKLNLNQTGSDISNSTQTNSNLSDVLIFPTIQELLIDITIKNKKLYSKKEIFVIGGAQLYNYFLDHNLINRVYMTAIRRMPFITTCPLRIKRFDGALYNSEYFEKSQNWKLIEHTRPVESKEMGYYHPYDFLIFEYVNLEELNILNTMKTIMETGYTKVDRTGVGTKSIFGCDLRFDLSDNTLPMMSTRSITLRMIFEELMWFLRGQTDNKILESKKVFVWTPNSTREFLDNAGLQHYEVGDIGPSYGHNFRHFGAPYVGCAADYSNQGVDQVAYVIDKLRNNPNDRRIIINLWDPRVLKQAPLPSCCYAYQFYVSPNKELFCKVSSRSSDISLAGNWNIVCASLLTIMMARLCGLTPKEVLFSGCDVHLYLNQLDGVKEQISRVPNRPFPKLIIKDDAPSLENGRDITEFKFEDLILLNYNPYEKIKLAMNA